MLVAGLAASYALRDQGDPARGIKPISFTGNPPAHVEVILEAGLALMRAEQPGAEVGATAIASPEGRL